MRAISLPHPAVAAHAFLPFRGHDSNVGIIAIVTADVVHVLFQCGNLLGIRGIVVLICQFFLVRFKVMELPLIKSTL